MPLETGTYISDLNVANPASNDGLVDADNHLRLIKSTLKTTFPNVTGAVTPTQTELNYVGGVTSAIQTQINTVSTTANTALPKSGGTMTGAITLAADPALALQAATKQYVDNGTKTSTQISDSTATGRSLLTAASSAAATAVLSPMVASGASHAAGLVPDPGAVAGTTKFLREDATWQTVSTSAPTRHVTVLTAGTTWTTNANHKWVTVTVIGGGGGGAGGSVSNGGGGGSGGIAIKTYTNLTANTAYTISIGGAGAAQATGGNTTFTDGTTLITGSGGVGTSAQSAGLGGAATNGDINIKGSPGVPGNTGVGGNGGSNMFGAGGVGGVNAAGGAAQGYGGGGGGSGTSATAGAGFTGAIIIEEWY